MRKRPMLTIAVANFHTWLQSSRVLSMLGCMVFYCLLQVVVDHSNYALEGEKTLLFKCRAAFSKAIQRFFTMGSLLFLVMVSEIPLRYAFQNFMLVRTSRIKWTLAQVLHSAAAVCFAMGILCLCFSLFATFYASPTSGFSENALVELGIVTEDYTIIPLYIRRLGSAGVGLPHSPASYVLLLVFHAPSHSFSGLVEQTLAGTCFIWRSITVFQYVHGGSASVLDTLSNRLLIVEGNRFGLRRT